MADYPRMMYHEDGRSKPVSNEDEEAGLDPAWSRNPSDVHRLARSGDNASPVPPVHQSGSDDVVERVIARMREEFFSEDAPIKRGPGRPPGTRNVSAERGGSRNVETKE